MLSGIQDQSDDADQARHLDEKEAQQRQFGKESHGEIGMQYNLAAEQCSAVQCQRGRVEVSSVGCEVAGGAGSQGPILELLI